MDEITPRGKTMFAIDDTHPLYQQINFKLAPKACVVTIQKDNVTNTVEFMTAVTSQRNFIWLKIEDAADLNNSKLAEEIVLKLLPFLL